MCHGLASYSKPRRHCGRLSSVIFFNGVLMDSQRLRNLTTGRLHTEIGHVYEDLEMIIGEEGLMTHMLPRVRDSVLPWLKEHVTESRFWDDAHVVVVET